MYSFCLYSCTIVHPFVNSAALLKYFLKLMLFVAYLTNVAFQSNVIFLVAELTGCDDSAVKMTKLSQILLGFQTFQNTGWLVAQASSCPGRHIAGLASTTFFQGSCKCERTFLVNKYVFSRLHVLQSILHHVLVPFCQTCMWFFKAVLCATVSPQTHDT